jgi:hypothetical protein
MLGNRRLDALVKVSFAKFSAVASFALVRFALVAATLTTHPEQVLPAMPHPKHGQVCPAVFRAAVEQVGYPKSDAL